MLQQQLDSISSHIRLNDTNEVHSFFSGAKSLGINFPLKQGALSIAYDLFM